jgi:RsiW-degrading membrane proteinase PrsW (M82 family)
MFFARFLLLGLVVLVSYAIGSGTNNAAKVAVFVFFITVPAMYLLPTYEAWKNKHPNLVAISLVNIFLGWSVLGWVAALIWAFKKAEPTPLIMSATQEPSTANVAPLIQEARETKKCPFCAEEVLVQAIKCKHCGSALSAQ